MQVPGSVPRPRPAGTRAGATARPGGRAPPPLSPAARAALAWAHTARFAITAAQLEQLPAPGLPEVAFVGRSNAGKSSAINALAQHKRLAFSSRMPGRTQHINLFEVGPRAAPDALFADLPGYGYAAVERGAKLRWQRVMADYLQRRAALAGIVLLVDSRLGLTDLDLRLLSLVTPRLAEGAVRLLVLLTKADKLNRRECQAALARCEAALGEVAAQAGEGADIAVGLFSTLSREGLADAAEVLHGWRQAASPAGRAPEAAAEGEGAEPGAEPGAEKSAQPSTPAARSSETE